jgi:hypothetical protein
MINEKEEVWIKMQEKQENEQEEETRGREEEKEDRKKYIRVNFLLQAIREFVIMVIVNC